MGGDIIEIKISIIVPVYNTANYLEKCINSLISQTLENIEIILVNDGSTDESASICNYYGKIDNRVKCIHKRNQGISAARNDGIALAKGKYLAFVDSDDYVERDMYETLYNSAEKNNADLIICNLFHDWPDGRIEKNVLKINNEIVSTEEIGLQKYFCKYWIGLKFANYVCNKLYRKELFLSNKILFPEDLRFIEDRALHYMLLPYTMTSVYINKSLYHYFQRETSASYTKGKEQNLVIHYVDVFYRTIEIWSKNGIVNRLDSVYPVFMCRMIQGAIYITRQTNTSNDYLYETVSEGIKSRKGVKRYLFQTVFGRSVTTYRKLVGLGLIEELKMRGFAYSCLFGPRTFKAWQKIYNHFFY